MADVGRFRLKQTPTDVWSIRERLALASSVSRSGDQNWVSVSRAVRPFGMPNRPSDWFSQKNCALQYSELLENVETPRRKRNEREAVETPGDVIVRKLTIERIEELKKHITKEAEEYRALKKDLENARAGLYDGQIKTMWEKLQEDKAAAAIAAEKAAAEEAAARERAKALKLKKPGLPALKSVPSSDLEDSTQDSTNFDIFANEDSNISLMSSVATPGPLPMPADTSMNMASPVISSLLPQSPKTEMLPSVDESVQQDVISIMATPAADLDETNAVEKFEVKQEEIVAEEVVEKTEVDEASDVVVKTEEEGEEPLDEEVSQDVIDDSVVVDEVEVKLESPAPEKDETTFFEKEDVTDDELIPFTPAEDNSPFVAQSETVVTEANDVKPVEEEFDCDAIGETTTLEEDVVEETVAAETEELHLPTTAEEEEVQLEEVETEETKDVEDSQQDVESKEEQVAVSVEMEAPKSEEVPVPTAEVASPASSIVSTEAGSVQSKKSNKRGRGRKPKRVRRPPNRARQHSEEGKESEVSSKEGESSDEEGGSRVQPAGNDDSLLISSLPQHLDPNESLPNSPASLSHSDTEDEKSHRVWKKSIMLVWRAATNHKCASVFLHPVTEDIAPGYHSIVHKPMDLQKIKRKIDTGEIRTTAEFQRDMMLMFTNAIMYNNADHDVHKMAKNMYKDVMGHIEQFVSTQMLVHSEPKLLRTLRRTDACSSIHSDKEEDPKRKRVPELEQTPATSGAKVKKRKL